MKLYEVPNNTRIKVINNIKVPIAAPEINKNDILKFHDIDGIYSYCTKDDGTVVYLVAWAEVELLDT